MRYTREQLDRILAEIAGFEVELAEDPTLPHLRSPYLHKCLSLCRRYLNRTVYYMQKVGSQLKELRREAREYELDLELKTSDKLADDELVRKQPSIEDRKALAASFLRDEHERLAALRIELLDFEETFKVIKFKHSDLVRTNGDIKLQRQIIRDEKDLGEEGYSKPNASSNGTIPDGMAPAVRPKKIDPRDLLDPDKRPEDMPEPIDAVHAQQIATYYNAQLEEQPESKPDVKSEPQRHELKPDASDDESPIVSSLSYDELL